PFGGARLGPAELATGALAALQHPDPHGRDAGSSHCRTGQNSTSGSTPRPEGIAVVPLYFAAPRPVVERDGLLIVRDDDRMPLLPGEVEEVRVVRFRSLGCYPPSPRPSRVPPRRWRTSFGRCWPPARPSWPGASSTVTRRRRWRKRSARGISDCASLPCS